MNKVSWIRTGIGLALACLASAPAWGEDNPICPDRPGKGTSPCTVDAGRWQVELGLYDISLQRRSGVTTDSASAGSLLLKYGFGSVDLEAGLALDQSQRVHDAHGTQSLHGIGDLYLHAKYQPWTGGRFALVFDPFIKLPTAGAMGNGAVEAGLVLPLAYDLGGGWSLAATPEADWLRDGAGGGYHLNAVNVIGLGRSFDNGLTLGAEIWTGQNDDPHAPSSQYSFDVDAALLTDANTQLDAGVNLGLNRQTPDVEFYAGVSRRF